MQEKVSIMCSWCGWENPSLGLRAARRWFGKPRHRLCCTTPSGWIFPSTPGTHERYLYCRPTVPIIFGDVSGSNNCFPYFMSTYSVKQCNLYYLCNKPLRKLYWQGYVKTLICIMLFITGCLKLKRCIFLQNECRKLRIIKNGFTINK